MAPSGSGNKCPSGFSGCASSSQEKSAQDVFVFFFQKFVNKIYPPKTKAARRGPAEVIFPVFVTNRTFLFFFRGVRVFPERKKEEKTVFVTYRTVFFRRVRVQLCIQQCIHDRKDGEKLVRGSTNVEVLVLVR